MLDQHHARRPRQAREQRQQARQQTAQVRRVDEHDQAYGGKRDGDPLHRLHPLVQEQPRQQHRPERHRVGEHGDPAGTAQFQPPERAGEVAGEQHAQQRAQPPLAARHPKRVPHPPDHRRKGKRADQETPGGRIGRRSVHQAQLHHDPVVAPDERQEGEGGGGTADARAGCSGSIHSGRLAGVVDRCMCAAAARSGQQGRGGLAGVCVYTPPALAEGY